MQEELEALLQRRAQRRGGRALRCLDRVDSTNNELKRLGGQAPDGLAVLALEQTGGRGRQGRSFVSPAGQGLYLSVLLHPRCAPQQLGGLTAWTAVAVCRAVQRVCPLSPGIKWPNDVILAGKKLCGILTELENNPQTGGASPVVVGIGINVSQRESDFGPEVAPVAISLAQALGGPPPRLAVLAAAVLDELDALYAAFPAGGAEYLADYRQRCLTLGHPVQVLRRGVPKEGWAEEIDGEFALWVRWKSGQRERLSAGEVSVRGLLGYV